MRKTGKTNKTDKTDKTEYEVFVTVDGVTYMISQCIGGKYMEGEDFTIFWMDSSGKQQELWCYLSGGDNLSKLYSIIDALCKRVQELQEGMKRD